MRKLISVAYTHTSKLDEETKDRLLIPAKFKGTIAIESWKLNGKLKEKGVCVLSVRDYILGFGNFKDVPLEREYHIYVCTKCGLQLEEKVMGKKCPDCGVWTYHKDCIKSVRIVKEVRRKNE